jgi:hypothetical protein
LAQRSRNPGGAGGCPAVFAVFAGNLQRGSSPPPQESWGFGRAPNRKTANAQKLCPLLISDLLISPGDVFVGSQFDRSDKLSHIIKN